MTVKTDFIRCEIEPELKTTVEKIFNKMGLSQTQAITLFYREIALKHSLPFLISRPNKETLETMEKAEKGEELTYCKDSADMFDKLGI